MKIDCDVLNSLSLYSLTITMIAIITIGIAITAKAQLPELPPLPPLTPEEDSQLSQPHDESTSFASDSQLSQPQQVGNLSFAKVYREYINSVVGIILPTNIGNNPNPVFDGTGFVYGKEGSILYVVTPAHVISGNEAGNVYVAFPDGSTYEASVQGSDPRTDIAVLELKHNATQERSVEPVRLGNSSAVAVGEEVLAVGNPFLGGGRTLPNLATRGIVGAAGVEVGAGGEGQSLIGAIVTDVPIAGGSSGSPLFNFKGDVIGMEVASDTGEQCCSYAVPANILKKVATSLIQKTQYDFPWIGITPFTLTTSDILAYGLPVGIEGVKVTFIDRGGPAHKAGIAATIVNEFGEEELGDIITAIDGHTISSADQFKLYIEENTSVGDTIDLSVFRNGKVLNIPVTLE